MELKIDPRDGVYNRWEGLLSDAGEYWDVDGGGDGDGDGGDDEWRMEEVEKLE